MPPVTTSDLLRLLHTRHGMIEYLVDGRVDKETVREGLEISRPTVDRAFRELEELGILTSEGSDFELTRFGRLCCDRFDDVLDDLETLSDVGSLLASLPQEAEVDRRLFEDARIIPADEHAPMAPIEEMMSMVSEAETFRGYSNTILPMYVDFFHRHTMEGDLDSTLVLSEAVMEVARRDYPDRLEDLLRSERCTLYETPVALQYGIAVADQRVVGVSIRDASNRLQGGFLNRQPEALAWAGERLDELIAESEPLEP